MPKEISREMTIRAYDRHIRDRFAEASKAIEIILTPFDERAVRVITLCFGRDIIAELIRAASEVNMNLAHIAERYDVMTVTFLARAVQWTGGAERCASAPATQTLTQQYFALMSCENVDSCLWTLCAGLHERIAQLREIIARIAGDTCEKCDWRVISTRSAYKAETRIARASANARRISKQQGAKNKERPACTEHIARDDERGANNTHRATDGAAYMSRQLIARVLESEKYNDFDSVKRMLRAADECIMRAMELARDINHANARDILHCEACGARVRVLPDVSEAVCDKCGRIAPVLNTADYSDTLACAIGGAREVQETRGRRGGYNFVRHLKIWLERLQAIENYEFDRANIERVRSSISSEYREQSLVNWRALTCDDVVRHLALCGLSHLGEHVPKLLKELGGRAPPILDYDSEQIIMRDFMHIMDIHAKLFCEPGNKPYYPFFIAKIVKRRFRGNPDLLRMLAYVSKQGHETVNKNDRIFRQICDAAPPQFDLVYEPEVE